MSFAPGRALEQVFLRTLIGAVSLACVLSGCDVLNDGRDTSMVCPGSELDEADGALAAVTERGGEIWALPFARYPAPVNEHYKIAFRVVGDGSLFLTAISPDGTTHSPVQGPTRHTGSNWDRPGDEWGSFFLFDQPGCWSIEVERGKTAGSVHILVSASDGGVSLHSVREHVASKEVSQSQS